MSINSVSGINNKIDNREKIKPVQVLSNTIHQLLKTGKVTAEDQYIQNALTCCSMLKTDPSLSTDEITMRIVALATSELNNKYKHLLK